MKLQRALYGLAISEYELYSQLTDTLVEMGFMVCEYNRCMLKYCEMGDHSYVLLVLYVNDILIQL